MSEPKDNKEQERENFEAWMREKDAFAWRDDEPGNENDSVANPLWRGLPGAGKKAKERNAQ